MFLSCTENTLSSNFNLPPVLSIHTYVTILIPCFKLNFTHTHTHTHAHTYTHTHTHTHKRTHTHIHTHYPGSILLHTGIFILLTFSTRSNQVPTSQLNTSMPCLYIHSHFSSTFQICTFIIGYGYFYTANSLYQLYI